MPELVRNLILTLKEQFPQCSTNSVTNIALAKIAEVLNWKRVRFNEFGNTGFSNIFVMIFLPSGYGKDRMVDDMDKHLLPDFFHWFNEEAIKYKQEIKKKIIQEAEEKFPENDKVKQSYIKEQLNKIRDLIPELHDGTQEGLFQDAKALKNAGYGGILIKMSELGLYLSSLTPERKKLLTQLNDAYSCKIASKSIKGENRENNIDNLPICALLYSDPTLFKDNIKILFNALMETGLGRRCFITFMHKQETYKIETDFKKAYAQRKQYFLRLQKLGQKFFLLFSAINKNAVYEQTEETFEVLYDYTITLKKSAELEENSLLCKEIISRELKALKLSTLFACLNHPTEEFIYPEDMKQAISTIEALSTDLKFFLNYKPKFTDKYDSIYSFFLEHQGQEFTKTELINNYRHVFCLSRDKLRAEFEKLMEVVQEIAMQHNYFIDKKLINNGSGHTYALKPIPVGELSEHVIPLDSLLSITENQ